MRVSETEMGVTLEMTGAPGVSQKREEGLTFTLGPPNSSVKGPKLGVPSGGASFPGLHEAKPRSLVGGL